MNATSAPVSANFDETALQEVVISHFWSGFPLLWISSQELFRVEKALTEVIRQTNETIVRDLEDGEQLLLSPDHRTGRVQIPDNPDQCPIALLTWDCRNGLRDRANQPVFRMPAVSPGRAAALANAAPSAPPVMPPDEVLSALFGPGAVDAIGTRQAIVVLRNFHEFVSRPEFARVRQQLQLLVEYEAATATNMGPAAIRVMYVVISPTDQMPDDIRHLVRLVDVPLPSPQRLQKVLTDSLNVAEVPVPAQTVLDRCVSQLCGLSVREAEDTISLELLGRHCVDEESIPTFQAAKAAVIRRNEAVTFVTPESLRGQMIEGFENVDAYVDRRLIAYGALGREYDLPTPKGLVLLGPAGTGKSEFAKLLALKLDFPAFTLDVGALFQKWVGESEATLRRTLKQVEAQNGAVLIIDEADKLLGGGRDNAGDSGVTSRIFGRLLTWLAEKKDRTFVVMTMNSLDNIPPEFTRTGRFDRIFYTDFPGPNTRLRILKEQLKRRGLEYDETLWSESAIAEFTEGSRRYTGVEIAQAVIEAQCDAAARRSKRIIPDALLTFLRDITPVYERYEGASADSRSLSTLRSEVRKFAKPVGNEEPDDMNTPAKSVAGTRTRRVARGSGE